MKKIILLVLVFGLVGCDNSKNTKDVKEKNNIQACEDLSKISGLIMKMRQSGMPASDILKSFEGGKGYSMDLIDQFIKEAYTVPQYEDPNVVSKEINEFQSKQFIECREMTK
ncbi:hypothetical protein [Acinetobacter baumannii]|uniref:hypothetical protein n=1 Tax=Acinetobacter baumannii TaxID=470 RepID=UPI00112C7E98|nr:hypothetical protein [Acinetobacter baumannii]EKU1551271.1 hypothetical protein [Acinetobacter baumannii]EKU2690949.1 hypothetical protein [Acinetobacter baumannii]EKU5255752.1 hypothetical protein [Acinetobacter baumannii]EKU6962137.1 hypothetical protein [Acinetobacter baumannii]EKU7214357.1 hypothetical protein [Acinetobacter baumannii]